MIDARKLAEYGPLLDASQELGSNSALVQGGGGNFSFKTAEVLMVKASGTRLSQAGAENIYLPLDLKRARANALVSENFNTSRIPDSATAHLRPSIETSLHAILPQRFVIHVHSVAAIAAGLSPQGQRRFRELQPNGIVIDYRKPGLALASRVAELIGPKPSADHPLVLLLRNHGLVVASQSMGEAVSLVLDVESRLRRRPTTHPTFDAATGWSYPPGTLSERQGTILASGAITPDSAVFLGRRPFGGPADSDHARGVVSDDGAVHIVASLGADEQEIIESLVDVGRQISEDDECTHIADAEVEELIDWEAEKWRHQMKR